MRDAERGLSLLELLITLAVLSILFTIGALNFGTFAQQRRLDEAARTVGETLREIGSEAAGRGEIVTFTLEEGGNALSWQGQDADSMGRRVLPHGASVNITQLSSGGTATVSSFPFTGRGFPDKGYSFSVTLNDDTKPVNLLATGAVVYLATQETTQ